MTDAEKRINQMPSVRKYCRGVATVVRNRFQRHVLTAVNWFAKRPYDYVVVASRKEADDWLSQRLATTGARRVG